MLLDTARDELAVLVDWCLAGQEDQAGNLRRMRFGRDQTRSNETRKSVHSQRMRVKVLFSSELIRSTDMMDVVKMR